VILAERVGPSSARVERKHAGGFKTLRDAVSKVTYGKKIDALVRTA
jgi:hypothetical protein